MKVRIVLLVTAVWLIAAAVWASQTVLEGTMLGSPIAAGSALQSSLIQTVPWIPVSLAIIALATRYPLGGRTWKRHLPIHLAAFIVLVWFENVLVVLGFWATQARFDGVLELAGQGVRWAMLRAHVAALVYVAIAGATHAMAYYRGERARELRLARLQGQLARARLDALNAQIRPHFLFNTLHTIGQLWRSGRADDADAMLDHLGSLFQRVRQSTEQPLVCLRDEVDMVNDYLAIEKVRFGDRMALDVHFDGPSLDCAVPPLLLQPIVENAVRHGIAPSSRAGRIELTGRVTDGQLVICVEDDGPGPGPDGADRPAAANGSGSGNGTGISNTRDRLVQVFGDAQSFEIGAREPRGTRVRIVVPAMSADDADDILAADRVHG